MIFFGFFLLFLQADHLVQDLGRVSLSDQVLGVLPRGRVVGRCDDPGVESVELGLVSAREIQVTNEQIVSVDLELVQAAHEADLHLGVRTSGLVLQAVLKVKVQRHDLQPVLLLRQLLLLLLALSLPLVAEGHDLS